MSDRADAGDGEEERLLRVNDRVAIPRAELDVRASRAGGPGGQHVNTSSTRIEVRWNVRTTGALSEDERARVLEKLASRIDGEGVLRVVASEHRSQRQNREAGERRLAAVIADALRVPKPRKKTRVPRSVKEARLQEKKRRGERKRERRDMGD
jgi:ribosome-associated protein